MFCGRPGLYRCVALCAWLTAGGLHAQSVIRQGTEFQVNQYTTNYQYRPAIGADADGDFVVSWTDLVRETNPGIFAARFSSAGVILASEFHVNTYTVGSQTSTSVAVESNGDFVIVWKSSVIGIAGRRFASNGAALGGEFNAEPSGGASYPDVRSDSDGDFVVVWQDDDQNHPDSDNEILGRRFASSGAALGTVFRVNTVTLQNQREPSVAVDSDGDFVVAWDSFIGPSSVLAQRFNSAGTKIATEFRVNSYTHYGHRQPSIAADADGDFVVAWSANPGSGYPTGIGFVPARRFSSSGIALATEFMVNVHTTGVPNRQKIAVDDDGDFVVTWSTELPQDGSGYGIFARRFRANGTAVGDEFQVNTYTFEGQHWPAIDWGAGGNFVVAWHSYPAQDGNSSGVFAQRFSSLATLDVDANGVVAPFSDGLLVLKRLIGLTGANLVSGNLIAGNCTPPRCDATGVGAYIDSIDALLDVDDNGATAPFNDGLLILKSLIGLTGANLVSGNLIAGNCTPPRCDAAGVTDYINGLKTP